MTYIRELNDLTRAIEDYPKMSFGRYIRDVSQSATHLRGKGGKFYPGKLEGPCWNHKHGGWELLSPDNARRLLYRKLTKREAREHREHLTHMRVRYQELIDQLRHDPIYNRQEATP